MTWWDDFPAMDEQWLSQLRRAIEGGFRDFSRAYGEAVELAFEPFRQFLLTP